MFQNWVGCGRLTKNPELRYTPNGTAMCTFTVAIDREYKKDGKTEADFIFVKVWGKLAELSANYLSKGRLVIVEGTWQNDRYEKDGQHKDFWNVTAKTVKFMPGDKNTSAATNETSKPVDISENIEDENLPF